MGPKFQKRNLVLYIPISHLLHYYTKIVSEAESPKNIGSGSGKGTMVDGRRQRKSLRQVSSHTKAEVHVCGRAYTAKQKLRERLGFHSSFGEHTPNDLRIIHQPHQPNILPPPNRATQQTKLFHLGERAIKSYPSHRNIQNRICYYFKVYRLRFQDCQENLVELKSDGVCELLFTGESKSRVIRL
jgi:hypothetical protein